MLIGGFKVIYDKIINNLIKVFYAYKDEDGKVYVDELLLSDIKQTIEDTIKKTINNTLQEIRKE